MVYDKGLPVLNAPGCLSFPPSEMKNRRIPLMFLPLRLSPSYCATSSRLITLALLTMLASRGLAADVVDVGNRRELFVDTHLIERLDNTRLELHAPRNMGVALQFDAPWEGAFCGYATVIRDGEVYRLYYRGLPEAGQDGSPREVTCYAESTDGITWEKPSLGLYEVRGSRDNNVILADAAPATHNFCPFLDTRPDVPADERYKALGGTSKSGLIAFASADGIRWRRLQEEPVYRDSGWVFDSQNVPFWSESEGCYVLYYRKAPERIRSVARATSSDFRHWSEPTMMTYGDTPAEHLYTNQTNPYFRAPHLYVGVAARFMPGRQVLSAEQAEAIGVNPRYFGDISDAVLLTSRGGNRYDRTFMEAFVRPGLGWENWVSRTNYPALGIVPTGDTAMSLYVQKNYGQPTARLDRYEMRLDGFASVRAPYAGGEVITKPLRFSAAEQGGAASGPCELQLNFATSAAGYVKVELQDADGTPLPGYSLDDAVEMIGDDLQRPATWKSGTDVSGIAGQPVRLRLVMKDADVFALQYVASP